MNTGETRDRERIDRICINTIRALSMDAIQQANSGHPGAPMGLAAAAYTLWTRVLRHNPRNPQWADRDRFVLSGGHASMLLYSLLHLTGYDLTLADIEAFRQWGSKTPGHPEYGHTPGVETTTGPLGQGLANAVGMAMAERHLAAVFNRPDLAVVDHYTYVICGDGDLMEGISYEAASLAGHLGLGKLIAIYDDNRISIEGGTDITFTEDVVGRFEACGWQVVTVTDGNDVVAIEAALQNAKSETNRPTLIKLRTHIAFGSPNKQDTADAHGAPLGEEEVCLTKECLGCAEQAEFCVPMQAQHYMRTCVEKGGALEAEWNERFDRFAADTPELADRWQQYMAGTLPADWDAELPEFPESEGPIATRAASGQVLNAAAGTITNLIGGSADLAPSNKTFLSGIPEFQKESYDGRNIRFGVREHAMGALINGLALHGGIRPYGGTFLVFADYMRPAIRLASLMKIPAIYVFTHDSIAVGEDGPTHQPVEHLASLRAIPGLTVIRPADARETAAAWRVALSSPDNPVALILSRQKLPILNLHPDTITDGVARGAYVVAGQNETPDVIIMATGSEVQPAMEARSKLSSDGISARIVSMPSWELFENTDSSYREQVLPAAVTARVAIEAGIPMGWQKYTGTAGQIIGMERFGASAPGGRLMQEFGFTANNIVNCVKKMLG